MLDRVQAACARLQALDIFQVVDVVLDVPREAWAPSHAVDVILHVREKSRLRINTGTYVGSQEGNLVRVRERARPAIEAAVLAVVCTPSMSRELSQPSR